MKEKTKRRTWCVGDEVSAIPSSEVQAREYGVTARTRILGRVVISSDAIVAVQTPVGVFAPLGSPGVVFAVKRESVRKVHVGDEYLEAVVRGMREIRLGLRGIETEMEIARQRR